MAGAAGVVGAACRAVASAARRASAAAAAAASAASRTSCLRIRPPTPVPLRLARSMPYWAAGFADQRRHIGRVAAVARLDRRGCRDRGCGFRSGHRCRGATGAGAGAGPAEGTREPTGWRGSRRSRAGADGLPGCGRCRRRGWCRGRALAADDGQRCSDGDGLVGVDDDRGQHALGGAGDLGVDLVGGDLEERLIGPHVVANTLEPPRHGPLRDGLT